METQTSGLRITFADWHHEQCAATECERAYCHKHRRVYWKCQDLKPVSSRLYCDDPPYSTLWDGEGECLDCRRQTDMRRYRDWSMLQNKNQAANY